MIVRLSDLNLRLQLSDFHGIPWKTWWIGEVGSLMGSGEFGKGYKVCNLGEMVSNS